MRHFLLHGALLGLLLGTSSLKAAEVSKHESDIPFQIAFPHQKTEEGERFSWGVYRNDFFAIKSVEEIEAVMGEPLDVIVEHTGIPSHIFRTIFEYTCNPSKVASIYTAFSIHQTLELHWKTKGQLIEEIGMDLPVLCFLSSDAGEGYVHFFAYQVELEIKKITFNDSELATFREQKWSKESITDFLKKDFRLKKHLRDFTQRSVAFCILESSFASEYFSKMLIKCFKPIFRSE